MAKLTLSTITSGYGSVAALNANFAAIAAAFENTLSRDGTTPNDMSGNIDMGGNRILNLGAPGNDYDPVRLIDLSDSDATGAASATLRSDLAASTGSSLVGHIASGTGAVARTVQDRLRDYVCIRDFMSQADRDSFDAGGLVDITTAYLNASALRRPVLFPSHPTGIYKHVGPMPDLLAGGGIIGEGWTTSAAAGERYSRIYFYNCTATTKGAINTRLASSPGFNFPRVENIAIFASSWDGTTGCLGYGFDIEAPIIRRNVYVQGFKLSGVFYHGGAAGDGPYQSLDENCVSNLNGAHGFLVGTGANVLRFVNPQGKYNGATTFGVVPATFGTGSGFKVVRDGDGNPGTAYLSYTPVSLSISGGDMSYNAEFGWDFSQFAQSADVNPGYAEANLGGNARTIGAGNLTRSGGTATISYTGHGLRLSETHLITVAGAVQTEYNGTFVGTPTDANTITYAVSGTPASPATGTITFTSRAQARIGRNVTDCQIRFGSLAGHWKGISFDTFTNANMHRNTYWYGGRFMGAVDNTVLTTAYSETIRDFGSFGAIDTGASAAEAEIKRRSNTTVFKVSKHQIVGIWDASSDNGYEEKNLSYSGTGTIEYRFVNGSSTVLSWKLGSGRPVGLIITNARTAPTFAGGGAAVSIDTTLGQEFDITATDGTAFAISNPTGGVDGKRISITVRNTSGGALGGTTFGAAYKLAAWTDPANGFSRTIDFKYNGTNWVEAGRTPADVPN